VPVWNRQRPYGDGRAISVFDKAFSREALEMQLKRRWPHGPIARGVIGTRPVLRSSGARVSAQEFHARPWGSPPHAR